MSTASKRPPAFLSYARIDSAFALRLAADLKAAGANVWLDQLDIHPGQRWDREVEQALAACSEMLVILSSAGVDSSNVMDEVSFALEERKTVIPVIQGECRIPFRLRRLQHVDFRADYALGLKILLNTLIAGDHPLSPAASPVQDAAEPAFEGSKPTSDQLHESPQDRVKRENAEAARKAEQDRIEREKAEAARKAEQDRVERENAEAARKAERDLIDRENAEAGRRAEQDRIDRENAEAAQKPDERLEPRLFEPEAEELEAASPAETKFATLLADPVAEGTSLDESPLKPPFLYRPWSYLILLGLAGALAFWLVSFGPLSSKRQNPAAESPAMTQQPASATPAAGPSGTSGNSDSAVPEGAPPLDAGKTTAPATQVSPPDNKAPESTNPPNPAPVAPLERKSAAIQPPHPGPKKPRESGQSTTEQPIAPQQLSGTIMEANLIRKVKPAYPTVAREARVQGAVEFTAIVSKEGNIAKLHLVRGQPLLVKAAQEAVIQWKYRPILINGKPVEVATQIIVDFTLTPATP